MGIGISIGKVKSHHIESKKDFSKEMATDAPKWMSLLQNQTVASLLEEEKFNMITINELDSTSQILQTLKNHNISSAPVRSATDEGNYIGIVDVEDLVTMCCALISPSFLTESVASSQSTQFLDRKTRQIVEISGRNWWQEVSPTQSLFSLLPLLSHPNVHRVAVVQGNSSPSLSKYTNDSNKSHYPSSSFGNVLGLVTQSMFLRFIHRYKSHFSSLLNDSIKNAFSSEHLPAGDRSKQVESIPETASFLEALKLLWEKEVSGIAVINEEGVFGWNC